MTQKFFQRIKNEGIVDTAKYRYTSREVTKNINGIPAQILQVIRIKIDDLGTTATLNNWEVVKERA